MRTVVAAAFVALALPTAALANPLGRDRDPLALAGSALPGLLGAPPARIVAFRYAGGWVQIPVQVDEKAVVDFGTIYNSNPSGFTVLAYTDTSTFAGPDPDPLFDANDELVLMGREAGTGPAPGAPEPAGVLPGTGLELRITNPLGGAVAYAYLFESDGSLDPSAGAPPLAYSFHLLSGNYRATYNVLSGPNPEDSRVTTVAYGVHFADRWIRDETRVTAGGATGADLLDRHKAMFAPGNCQRTENTFSNGEGAFIANRAGPVRALRGYVGANSGPTTYRVHTFYESREDILTALRVHAIPGIMDLFDYAPAASGMVYRNDLNPGGVTIDGNPDAVAPGAVRWEMVTGSQGTLAMTSLLATDIPGFMVTSYYSDDSTPSVTQCTGDAFEYGTSGFWRNGSIPNTDPALGAYYVLEARRVIAYAAPGQDAAFAQAASLEAANPLAAVAAPYTPAAAVAGVAPPRGLALSFAPNPVRGALRVSFALPSGGPFALRLYDSAGRAVAMVAEGTWSAGAHEVVWDASRLAPGVYFARASGAGAAPLRLVRVR